MNIAGSRQRLCLGGWFLAALLLAGWNAYGFMSLEQQPLVGYSPTIKMLRADLQQFDDSLGAGLLSVDYRKALQRLLTPKSATADPQVDRKPAAVPVDPAAPASSATGLPSLSGIMQVLDAAGSTYFQAVLNGRVCREMDRIDDYIVAHISPVGVVLQRSGRQWLIKSPTPYYSSDQGK
jgi:hypothetical protein